MSTQYEFYIPSHEAKNLFNITLNYSTFNKVKVYLFLDCKFENFEFVQALLIKNPSWVYHYYIPNCKNINYSNILILGVFPEHDFCFFFDLLNFSNCIHDPELILNFIGENINWEIQNIFTHSCKWSHQEFFADLLDFVSDGDINKIPLHWYLPINSEKKFNFKIYS